MFKNVSLVLGSVILSTSMALAAPAKEAPKMGEKGTAIEKGAEKKAMDKAAELIRGGKAVQAGAVNQSLQRDAVTESRMHSVSNRSALQRNFDVSKDANLGKAEIVKGNVAVSKSNAAADNVVRDIEAIGPGALETVASVKGLDFPATKSLAQRMGARVRKATLVAAAAMGLITGVADSRIALAADPRTAGQTVLNRGMNIGAECGAIGEEAGKSVEEQSLAIGNLAKSLEGAKVARGPEELAKLMAANLEKAGLSGGLERVAALGGVSPSNPEGVACKILNPVVANAAAQLMKASN